MGRSHPIIFEDPLAMVGRVFSKIHSLWLAWTYPFAYLGKHVWFHHSSELRRPAARYIAIGRDVLVSRDARLEVLSLSERTEPAIILEDRCGVGRRCTFSAKNQIHIGRCTVFGPGAIVMDHNDTPETTSGSRLGFGAKTGGTIRIEEECWIGYGAAILCDKGELVIGKHSVIGANSVVRESIPSYSVVSGNPARIVKQYDWSKKTWVLGSSARSGSSDAHKDPQRVQAANSTCSSNN